MKSGGFSLGPPQKKIQLYIHIANTCIHKQTPIIYFFFYFILQKWMKHLRREIDHYNDRKDAYSPRYLQQITLFFTVKHQNYVQWVLPKRQMNWKEKCNKKLYIIVSKRFTGKHTTHFLILTDSQRPLSIWPQSTFMFGWELCKLIIAGCNSFMWLFPTNSVD